MAGKLKGTMLTTTPAKFQRNYQVRLCVFGLDWRIIVDDSEDH
jgi:hypothetical protein